MRREVARVAVTAAWIALAVLAIPLAVSVYLLVAGDERGELERAALRAAVRIDPAYLTGDPAELPRPEPGGQLGLYDPAGHRRAGTGPVDADPVTRRAQAGRIVQGSDDGQLVVAVPAAGGEAVTGVIRAASPAATVWRRTAIGWAGLAALMATALLAALAVARRRARRLAAPLEQLAAASRAVGDGDFTARVPACGIEEIDRVAATQNSTAGRLAALLERERQFTTNASHQLRTPLAGLQLGLEAARTAPDADPLAALDEALATTRRLQATVEDVLAMHRADPADTDPVNTDPVEPPTGLPGAGRPATAQNLTVERVLEDVAARWHGQFAAAGRQLVQGCDPETALRPLPSTRVGQVLDILLDNALKHGQGRVQITARPVGSATAIAVTDEGPGIGEHLGDVFRRGTGQDHGIGLGLARDFATTLGGRLVLSTRTPPVFTLLLPDAGIGQQFQDGLPEPTPVMPDEQFSAAGPSGQDPRPGRLPVAGAAALAVGLSLAAGLAVVAATIYDAVTESEGVAGLDSPVLEWMVAHRTTSRTSVVSAFTMLGGGVWMPVLATVIGVGLGWAWRSWWPALLLAGAAAGSLTMTVVGKAAVGRARPLRADAVAPFESSASFPSGHTLNAVVVSGVVCYLVLTHIRSRTGRVVAGGVAVGFSAAMGFSRVYLGQHWLSDVLAAWVLGAAWLALVVTAHRWWTSNPTPAPGPPGRVQA